jgi:hypothetical protein
MSSQSLTVGKISVAARCAEPLAAEEKNSTATIRKV